MNILVLTFTTGDLFVQLGASYSRTALHYLDAM